MRISDWSSDVCSSDLDARSRGRLQDDTQVAAPAVRREQAEIDVADDMARADREIAHQRRGAGRRGIESAGGGVAVGRGLLRGEGSCGTSTWNRKRAVEGKSVSERATQGRSVAIIKQTTENVAHQ